MYNVTICQLNGEVGLSMSGQEKSFVSCAEAW